MTSSMTPERWQQVKDLLQGALELGSERRAEFLDRACVNDELLRVEVESLVASHEQMGAFINEPPLDCVADLVTHFDEKSLEGKLIGPYKIVREIGRGGMGDVYLAVRADDEYRKRVAIKLVKRGMDTNNILRRFRNERQILASLDHPNTAKLLDGGTTQDGLPYFVMEYIEGVPINEYCDTHKLSTVERLKLFRIVCLAVHSAHQNLVVHRDIKPSNILITSGGVPKLLDFGIAKLLNPELSAETIDPTATSLRLMTPEYASPEQVRGETITTASDIYSLGVVLYELLTGHRPYRVKALLPQEMLRVICEEDPVKPSTAVSRVEEMTAVDGVSTLMLTPDTVSKTREGQPEKLRRRLVGDLDNIVLMAMRKEARRRYASVEQFSEDIRRHLEGLPVIARKDTFGYRAEKFIKRHKAAAAAVSIILLILVGGIITTAWQAHIATTQRARAERRFNDVRKLARFFIFELNDAIQNLPGSTKARELLVKRALEYLDSLAEEASDDRSLQLELATAYVRVGSVQWHRYAANLGDLSGAFESNKKALAIREAVLQADPSNLQARADLASSYFSMGDLQAATGDLAAALESYRKSLAIREEMLASDPTNPAIRKSLADTYARIGDTLGNPGFQNLGDTDGALESFIKMQAINETLAAEAPTSPEAQENLAAGYERIGRILVVKSDLPSALEFYGKELAIFEAISKANPANAHFRREASVGYFDVGGVLETMGDKEGALEHYRKGLQIREELVRADPANAGVRLDLARIQDVIAHTLVAKGDHSGALENFRNALAIFEEQYAANPNDQSISSRLAGTLNSLASLAVKMGNNVEARSYSIRALAMKKAEADKPTATASDLNDYAWSLLTWEPADLRNPTAALAYARRAVELTKESDTNILDTLATAYHLTGDYARAIETEEKALSLMKGDSPQRTEFQANLTRFKAASKGERAR